MTVLEDREGDAVAAEVRAVRTVLFEKTVVLLLLATRPLETAPTVVIPAPKISDS